MRKLWIICLTLVISVLPRAHAQQVDTFMAFSPSMHKNIPNLVVLPASYYTSDDLFPVLYLLHGAGGSHLQWQDVTENGLQGYSDQFDIIIVCPDGGGTSWYFDSPVDSSMRYETYISSELILQIDTTYRTRGDRKGRAITGLSMGGHGAFYLGIRHPEIWGAAGSTSGGMDIRPFPEHWDLPLRLGKQKKYSDNWEQHTVINQAGRLKGSDQRLLMDCGADDFFFEVNERMHEKLVELGVPHEYIIRPGNHGYVYWKNSIQYQMIFFDAFFDQGQ